MYASERDLGITPIISSLDIADPEVDHIAVMAYAAWHMHVQVPTTAFTWGRPVDIPGGGSGGGDVF